MGFFTHHLSVAYIFRARRLLHVEFDTLAS